MPARSQFSRHLNLTSFVDDNGKKAFESYIAYRFRNFPGNQYVDVQEGENLWILSFRFYGTVGLWWVLADFNNIHDPTEKLEAGRTIIVPPREAVLTSIVGT